MALAASIAPLASAQTYSEAEPNESRATATLIPPGAGAGMQPGETIGGLSTGNSTTTAGNGSADYFRLRIGTAPLAIYKQKIVVTNGTATQNYGVSLRGYSQTAAGVISTTSDASVASNSTVTAPRFITWYGFGKGEFVNLRIDGASTTTANYSAELTRSTVTPQSTTHVFGAGPITISSLTAGASTTDFWVYDANLDPVATFGNDDNTVLGGGTGSGGLSIATRNLSPGTYYVAISTFNLANDQPSPFDERGSTLMNVWSDPGAVSNSASSVNQNVNFTISDGSFTETVPLTKVEAYDVAWAQFTVGAAQNILATPSVTPAPLVPGANAVFSLTVTRAPTPPNTITSATFDLSPLGLASSVQLFDDGAHSDGAAGDGVYAVQMLVPNTAPPGSLALSYNVTDNGGRSTSGSTPVTVSPVVPSNDDCSNPIVLTGGSLPYAATIGINLATADGPISCSTAAAMNNGIWYQYTPSANCIFAMRETGSRDVAFVVYTGGCGFSGTEVFCDTGDTDANFPMTAGTTYWILVGTPGSASTGANDAFALTFDCGAAPTPPINDNCGGAITLVPSASFVVAQNVGGATEDNLTSCITTPGVNGARNGVWYTYTTGAQDQLARLYRGNDGQFISAAIYTGPCIGPEVACLNLGTVTPGTGVPLHRNTTYSFMIHRRTGYAAADATFQFVFNIENYPNVSNPDCATATVVSSLPFVQSQNNILAFDDPTLNACPNSALGNAAGASGVWYAYTPAQPTIVKVEETSAQDAAVAAFEGSCGGVRVMCSQTDTDTSGSNIFRANPGVTYYIFVGRQSSGLPAAADTLDVSITGVVVPAAPSNDECANATVITSVPFSDNLSNAMAADESFKAVCARGTISNLTRNGVWYRYTNGPTAAAAIMAESTSQDAMIAAYKGVCGTLVPVMCTDDPESNNYLYMEPNTTYTILVAHAFDFPSQGTETLSFTFDLAPTVTAPPANDNCATARYLKAFPFNSTELPLAANHEPDTACSGAAVLQATNGVWYRIDGGAAGFTLSVTETVSSPNVMYALYEGVCNGPEIGCQTTDTARTFALAPNTSYYLLVARESNSDYTLGATQPNLTITAAAGTAGACCTGTACVATNIEGCTAGFIPGATCDAGNPVACCPANINGVGGVTVQDIFDFLGFYFSQNPAADFNGNGAITVQDIFDFLAAYFAGC
jgi:hypothetical protein